MRKPSVFNTPTAIATGLALAVVGPRIYLHYEPSAESKHAVTDTFVSNSPLQAKLAKLVMGERMEKAELHLLPFGAVEGSTRYVNHPTPQMVYASCIGNQLLVDVQTPADLTVSGKLGHTSEQMPNKICADNTIDLAEFKEIAEAKI